MKERSQVHRVKKPDLCPKCGKKSVETNFRLAAPMTHSPATHPACCNPQHDPAWVCGSCGEQIFRVIQ